MYIRAPRSIRIPAILIITLVAVVTCARRSGDTAGHVFHQTEEDGMQVAVTRGGPLYEGDLFTYEPILTLKEDPENEESLLFRPGQFTMDSDGFFYLVDGGNYRIAVFDPGGTYVSSYGRRGEGPGEFLSLSIQYLDSGILHIYDGQMDRTSRYATDGRFIDVTSFPQRGRSLFDLFLAPNGLRICTYIVSRDDDTYYYSGRGAVFVTPEGDTIATLQTPLVPTMYRFFTDRGSGSRSMDYSATPVAEYYPGKGLLLTGGLEPVLRWYDLDGNCYSEIRLDQSPEPVTEDERVRIIQRANELVQNAQAQNRPVAATRAAREALKILDTKAYWDGAMVDDRGYVWLRKPEPYVEMREVGGFEWRVLSPEGEYLGDTRLPWYTGTIVQGRFLGYTEDEETGLRPPTVFLMHPAVKGFRYP